MAILRTIRCWGFILLAVGCISLYYTYPVSRKPVVKREPGGEDKVPHLHNKLNPLDKRRAPDVADAAAYLHKLQVNDASGEPDGRDKVPDKLQAHDARGDPDVGDTVSHLHQFHPDGTRSTPDVANAVANLAKLQAHDAIVAADAWDTVPDVHKHEADDTRVAPDKLIEQNQGEIDVETLAVNDQASENITDYSYFEPTKPVGLQVERFQQSNVVHQESRTKEEVRHIAFLKVHKAASTTLQTMFFRFGHERNLSFVLPVKGYYVSSSPVNYKPLLPPAHGDHYDIICNHAFFNYTVYSNLMPKDTVYISVIRDPFRQFISAFHYYTNVYKLGYLMKIPQDPIINLIKHPNLYDRKLSLTMNSMARDFGFLERHYNDQSNNEATEYLKELGSMFDFVIVAEYFDESLVLMKRILGWSLKDILYMSKNVRSPDDIVSDYLMEKFKKRNRLDYLIYNFFYNRFMEKVYKAENDFPGETQNFKDILLKVQTWCEDHTYGILNINGTFWNDPFTLTVQDCTLMSKKELAFIEYLKK